jgi:hypothetical protein
LEELKLLPQENFSFKDGRQSAAFCDFFQPSDCSVVFENSPKKKEEKKVAGSQVRGKMTP